MFVCARLCHCRTKTCLTGIAFFFFPHSKQDYHDEIDLLGNERPKSSATPQPEKASASTSATDLTALAEISLADDEESTAPAGDHTDRPTIAPSSISDLALDSATKEIRRLEIELKKVDADRDHWKTLAKQVSAALFILSSLALNY